MQQDIYMTTGEFARMMRVSKDTLFHYDKIGLLKPEVVKTNGYRYYSVYQADLLEAIFMLRDLGMPLKEIQEHLAQRHPQTMERLFAEREVQIDREIEKLQSMKRWLRWNRERIRDAAEIDTAILPLQQDDRRHGPGNLHEIFQAYRAADRSGAGGSVLLRCAAASRKHRRGAVHFLR